MDIERDRLAPSRARQAVRQLEGTLDAALVPDLTLLVSELVSNSVKYGQEGAVRLRIASRAPWHVHVEVIDQGGGFTPIERDRPSTEPGGWGLHLVERLADRWGIRAGATRVWFEMDREARAAA